YRFKLGCVRLSQTLRSLTDIRLNGAALRSPMRHPCVMLLCCACSSGAVQGLAAATPSGGPKLLFDLQKKPLPEIPFPNDLATRPDPSSPTGLRIDPSHIAPTRLEPNVRRVLDTQDGLGTDATT